MGYQIATAIGAAAPSGISTVWNPTFVPGAAARIDALPPGVLAEARASIESTRKTLLSWPESLPRGRAAARGGDGAQPNVDRDLLEKMYRDLGLLP